MDTGTYPKPSVIKMINEYFIPVRMMMHVKPWSTKLNVHWTPCLLILDAKGTEHYRTIGYLKQAKLLPELLLGMGKTYFNASRFDKAIEHFDKLLHKYPTSSSAPEAIYFRGVSLYKSTHEPAVLKESYSQLRKNYPQSEWRKKAYPFRLLEAIRKVA